MSLEEASLVSQIISAVAVVASLIFVGFQLRQNTKAMRASTSQAHSATYLQIASALIENGEAARIWRLGLDDIESLTDDERVRFIALASTFFRFFEVSRVQWRREHLDAEHWHTIEQQVIALVPQPGIKAWWSFRRHWYSADFQKWFESLTPAGPPLWGKPPDVLRKETGATR